MRLAAFFLALSLISAAHAETITGRVVAIQGKPARDKAGALNAYGLNGGYIRPPRVAISGAELDDTLKSIEALKIPEMAGWQRQY